MDNELRHKLLSSLPAPGEPLGFWLKWAETAFRPNPLRLAHLKAVHLKSKVLPPKIPLSPELKSYLEIAALTHDLALSFDPKQSEMHAFQGARFLEEARMPYELCWLVARHSGSFIEAFIRGIGAPKSSWPDEPSLMPALHILDYLDATTGPGGEELSTDERYQDIETRYGPEAPQSLTFKLNLASVYQGRDLIGGDETQRNCS